MVGPSVQLLASSGCTLVQMPAAGRWPPGITVLTDAGADAHARADEGHQGDDAQAHADVLQRASRHSGTCWPRWWQLAA